MKFFAVIFISLWLNAIAFGQNNCVDAIIVCGDGTYNDLAATGFGIQELSAGNNACFSQEYNSIWLKILINDGGTLGFNLVPATDDLVIDFDFWIFGPNVSCNNLGTAVRCSTTNPLAAGQTNNLTGMNSTETDVSEGPGFNGNSYIREMVVQDNETYYIIIDRPHGFGNFSIEWTGTATFYEIPVFLNPENISIDLVKCDGDTIFDNFETFDLTTHAAMLIGGQDDVELTYHVNLNDATTGTHAIPSPGAYTNTSSPQTLYMRMTNIFTGCYATETFTIRVNYPEFYNPLAVPLDLEQCDRDGNNDGFTSFDLTLHRAMLINGRNATISYYTSQADALQQANAIPTPNNYTNTSVTQSIFMRLDDNVTGCFNILPFTIKVKQLPFFNNPQNININLEECDKGTGSQTAVFNLARHQEMFIGGQQGISTSYYVSLSDATNAVNSITGISTYQNISNPQIIYIRFDDAASGCHNILSFELKVRPEPVFMNPQGISLTLEACDNDGVSDGKTVFDLTIHRDMLEGTQPDVSITYHTTQGEAIAGTYVITAPQAYTNTTNPQVIYMRITDAVTKCFTLQQFALRVNPLPIFNNHPGISLNLEQCDSDATDDQSYVFDLETHAQMLWGPQQNVAFSFYISEADAVAGTNRISNPAAFRNTVNPQPVFVRLTNTLTGCFSITVFEVKVVELLDAGEPADLSLCDVNNDGYRIFDLTVNNALLMNGNNQTFVRFYRTEEDARNEVNPVNSLYQNTNAYTTETLWARLENTTGCFGFDIKPFTLNILPLPDIEFSVEVVDFTYHDNSITIVMPDPQGFEFSADGEDFSDNPVFDGLDPGIYKVYVRAKNHCKTAEREVVLLYYPKFFTPNGDGINDYWQVKYLFTQPKSIVTIFDRFGKILTRFSGTSHGWDGIYNNSRLPSTDYWFLLELEDGRTVKGHFAMLR
ncbi:hypothetical protein CHU92_08505 [Flavobacterium cyanobacteriorum]|uniref:T9SS type B sorting domain-containing protein n=1 Tax=Flavobacterium cyanobacteriorum TaxID=2022802 RepID=A0A255Z7A8_9FLAO|nr:T9SS type B sorting domain-containing protein [Flavobacterium cyanobacteriorum]OYQ37326.1 hypothetical protein CHU92_08505 [Flavobacterium cyanobacteriorum]